MSLNFKVDEVLKANAKEIVERLKDVARKRGAADRIGLWSEMDGYIEEVDHKTAYLLAGDIYDLLMEYVAVAEPV